MKTQNEMLAAMRLYDRDSKPEAVEAGVHRLTILRRKGSDELYVGLFLVFFEPGGGMWPFPISPIRHITEQSQVEPAARATAGRANELDERLSSAALIAVNKYFATALLSEWVDGTLMTRKITVERVDDSIQLHNQEAPHVR